MKKLITLSIEEFLDAEIQETEANEYGTYNPKYAVTIVDEKKLKMQVYVANNGDGYLYGLNFEYSTGGGGYYPSKNDTPLKDKRKGLENVLDRLCQHSMYKRYVPYIEEAKMRLKCKQLTIFDI